MAAIEGAAAALDARVSATESGIEENGAEVAAIDARLEALEANPIRPPGLVLVDREGEVVGYPAGPQTMWLRLRSSRFALFSVQFGIGAALDQAFDGPPQGWGTDLWRVFFSQANCAGAPMHFVLIPPLSNNPPPWPVTTWANERLASLYEGVELWNIVLAEPLGMDVEPEGIKSVYYGASTTGTCGDVSNIYQARAALGLPEQCETCRTWAMGAASVPILRYPLRVEAR